MTVARPVTAAAGASCAAGPGHMAPVIEQTVTAPIHGAQEPDDRHMNAVRRLKAGRSASLGQQRSRTMVSQLSTGAGGQRTGGVPILGAQVAASSPLAIVDNNTEHEDRDESGKDGN